MYLFKNDDNKWIFGNTIHSECPAGIYRVDPSADYTKITIRSKERDVPIVKDELVTNFLKSDGTRYANFTALQAGYDGFFETSVTADVALTNADVVSAEQSDATKLNMTEASAADIKTALEIIDNFISGSRGLVTEDNSADIKTAANTIMGQDFLCISDTNAHGTLDCTMVYVMADAVFTDITVGGSNVVTAKGLNSLTIKEGTMLPFGKAHVTSITLASGTVIAYIN